jgi:flagellar motor switch protein FliN/FliY
MGERLTAGAVTEAIAAELSAALEAALGAPVSLATTAAPGGAGWQTVLRLEGALAGDLVAWMDAAGAARTARQVMHLDDEPDAGAIAEMLRELWSHAARLAAARWPQAALEVTVAVPVAVAGEPLPVHAWQLALGDEALATVGLGGELVAARVPARPAGDVAGNLAVLMDIELPLVVRFAQTELTLRALSGLGPGSMLDMGRAPEDPVQVLVGGQVVAEGDVVMVNGNYGVRIASVLAR